MPELPEVETTRRGVSPHVTGSSVSAVQIREPRLRWPVPAALAAELPGLKLKAVYRRAKYLLFDFQEAVLIVHLGMSGNLRVVSAGDTPAKHDHVDISFANGRVLRYTDPRRFGSMHWYKSAETETADCYHQCLLEHQLLCDLGPEPLSEDFHGERLYQRSRGRRQAVKTFLMDNQNVVGVGNIYANEALFRAGIRPDRAASRISLQRYCVLADEVKKVLAGAIEQGGTTLRDFVGGDGKPGYFKQQLSVYGRKGLPCLRCAAPLQEIRLGQRSTVFCLQCQR